MQEKIKILGVNIDNITEEEAAIRTKELIEKSNKSCKLIVAPNVEFIMQAQKDKEFFDILQKAELATPDSIGVIIGGKLQKKPFKQRIPGQAYFRKILETSEKEGWTICYPYGAYDDRLLALLKKYNCAKKLMLHGFQHVCHCFSAELDSKDTP